MAPPPAPVGAIPPPAPGEVARGGLIGRLEALRGGSRLVLVSAPAGYGKTTVLAQWARSTHLATAWVSLREDPLAAACDALRDAGRPLLVVVDDLGPAASGEALAAVAALVADLPAGSRVALGCRTDPDLLLGRRLLEGGLVRIGPDDLAFTDSEAAALMAGAGIGLAPATLARLQERTEGWPAGLRLAALRIADRPDPSAGAQAFGGDDRLVVDYLREEVLAGLPDDQIAFLTRTSVLDRLSADVCDAVTGGAGGAATLLALERSSVPLVPLDTRGSGYRHRRMVRDMLRAELLRREPELAPVLHRRASAWLEAAGDGEAAARHALAAGDADRAAELTWRSFPADLTRGRAGALGALLAGFDIDRVAASATLSLASAWCCAEGRGDLAGHHLSLAERAAVPPGAGHPDGVVAGITALRALLAREGLGQMARDAAEGFRVAPDAGPWRSYCRFVEGAALHLGGDLAGARALLEDGIERAGRIAPSVHALCLSQMALLLLDDGEPVRGLMLARRARAVLEEWGLASYASAALSHAVCALALAGSEHDGEARDAIGEARHVLSQTVDASPWLAVQIRLVIARAGLAVGEEGAARDALAETERFLGSLGDTPVLRDGVEHLSRRVRPVPEGDAACLSSITAAETRVLRLLPTHHSFREIGDLLFLSRFTVKSHAHSLYRKLGVASRSEAVERARQLRILGPAA